ncbi:MAG: 16S rRNA (guanine(527)-N(7))-methyltransferase RsmG [Ignavibacteria bacterium]|nr:16S rRNA (guanine(527)-N(7))-methyltransferase RsmG [Ignavibacteria bacterium]
MDTLWFGTTCAQNGLHLNSKQLATLGAFAALLLGWNKKINLISRRDEENIWTSHLLHCLSLLFKVNLPAGSTVLDLGTGGGLPGIPLKIVRPDLRLTLLDSTQKKINAVKDMVSALGLQETKAVWGRAEDVGKKKEHNRDYDVVVARAVASLDDLVRWSGPFLKPEAATASTLPAFGIDEARRPINKPTLIAFKGGDLEGEIRRIKNQPQVRNISVIDLTLKGSHQPEGGEKKIVLVELANAARQKAE